MQILIADGDPAARAAVIAALRCHWPAADVAEAANAPAALRAVAAGPDLVVLDLALPGDALAALAAVRAASDAPVLVTAPAAREIDEVRALEAGADMYLARPFGDQVLLARLQALLRRANSPALSAEAPGLALGGLVIGAAGLVSAGEATLALTPAERLLLAYLARHPGRALPSVALLRAVWGVDYPATNATLKVLVSRLRRKLTGTEVSIQAERGLGYRLVLGQVAAPAPGRAGTRDDWAEAVPGAVPEPVLVGAAFTWRDSAAADAGHGP